MPYWYENPIPWFNNQCADRFTEAALLICHVGRTGCRLWCTRDHDLSSPYNGRVGWKVAPGPTLHEAYNRLT
jgi:hypothetical protein